MIFLLASGCETFWNEGQDDVANSEGDIDVSGGGDKEISFSHRAGLSGLRYHWANLLPMPCTQTNRLFQLASTTPGPSESHGRRSKRPFPEK